MLGPGVSTMPSATRAKARRFAVVGMGEDSLSGVLPILAEPHATFSRRIVAVAIKGALFQRPFLDGYDTVLLAFTLYIAPMLLSANSYALIFLPTFCGSHCAISTTSR